MTVTPSVQQSLARLPRATRRGLLTARLPATSTNLSRASVPGEAVAATVLAPTALVVVVVEGEEEEEEEEGGEEEEEEEGEESTTEDKEEE